MGFIRRRLCRIGIRMVSEWFPANQLGTAEGIYGGWGNFGSAAGAMLLPTLALMFGGDDGWRYAVGITGLMSLAFSFRLVLQRQRYAKGFHLLQAEENPADWR